MKTRKIKLFFPLALLVCCLLFQPDALSKNKKKLQRKKNAPNSALLVTAVKADPTPIYDNKYISINDVVKSVEIHYPKIQEAKAKIQLSEGKLQEAGGEFDTYIKYSSTKYSGDYYDSRYSMAKVEKKFSFAGATIYGGKMHSSGALPLYEASNFTRSDGAKVFGGEVSLLKGLIINDDGLKLDNLGLEVEIEKYKLELTKVNTIIDAKIAFLETIAAKSILDFSKKMLDIVTQRQDKIDLAVQKGAMAKMYAQDNRRYMLKRQSEFAMAQNYFVNKLNKLAIYLRDSEGNMQNIDSQNIPPNLQFLDIKSPEITPNDTENLYKMRPEFKLLEKQATVLSNKYKISINTLLPDLNLSFQKRHHAGDIEPKNALVILPDRQNYVKANFSMPLEFNRGRGEMATAKAEIRMFESRLKLLRDTMYIEANNLRSSLDAMQVKLQNTGEELAVAQQLSQMENAKYQLGAGDFFMINMREDMLNEVKIRATEAKFDYMAANIKYRCLVNWNTCVAE